MAFTFADLYRAVKNTPNPNQKCAPEPHDGLMVLVNGPGSSRFRVPLWRTARLILLDGTNAERIFFGTFTEKAAQHFVDGLLSPLGVVTSEVGVPYDRCYASPLYHAATNDCRLPSWNGA